MLGEPSQLRAWSVPAEAVKAGQNHLEFALPAGGATARLTFIDLALS
jgi:hypothetical protein